MSVKNVGRTERVVRFFVAAGLFVAGLVLAVTYRTPLSVVVAVGLWAAAYLMFNSANEQYCPIHEKAGIDTTSDS